MNFAMVFHFEQGHNGRICHILCVKLLFSKPGPFEGEGFASILAKIRGVNLPLAPPVPTSLCYCVAKRTRVINYLLGMALLLHCISEARNIHKIL